MAEVEAAVENKLKNLNVNNPSESLKAFINIRPLNSKNVKLIRRDLEAFQFIVSKISEKETDSLVKSLSEDEATVLIDYLHRYMQFVS